MPRDAVHLLQFYQHDAPIHTALPLSRALYGGNVLHFRRHCVGTPDDVGLPHSPHRLSFDTRSRCLSLSPRAPKSSCKHTPCFRNLCNTVHPPSHLQPSVIAVRMRDKTERGRREYAALAVTVLGVMGGILSTAFVIARVAQ